MPVSVRIIALEKNGNTLIERSSIWLAVALIVKTNIATIEGLVAHCVRFRGTAVGQ